MKYISYLIFSLFIYILLIISSQPNNDGNKMNISLVNEFKIINTKNIFFGHQSVGNNILQGIQLLQDKNNPLSMTIINMENNRDETSKYFIESKIGSNGIPKNKIYDFCQKVNQLEKNNLDIAMMKLCYADIKSDSDINDIFKYYSKSIDSLQKKYPNLKIIHITVPLTARRNFIKGIKDLLKRRSDSSILDNVERNKFNKLLSNKYSSDRIFDLAKLESTYPDGSIESFAYQGNNYNSLVPEYTDDGGHLNDEGKQVVAEEYIKLLKNLIIR